MDSEADSNQHPALTLACAKNWSNINRCANIKHKDKKGFIPLILVAKAGHEKIVGTLLQHGGETEAQFKRTKDSPPTENTAKYPTKRHSACCPGRLLLTLAVINGHTVKPFLGMGSDIDTQIQTNRNTAVTLTCVQGHQSVADGR